MMDSLKQKPKAPGEALLDAAPGSGISSNSPFFCGYSTSPTVSDAGALPSQPPPPPPNYQSQQQQPSSTHTLPLTTNNSSFSFSLYGSDAFGLNDLVNSNGASPTQQQPPQQPITSSCNNNNSVSSGGSAGYGGGGGLGAPMSVVGGTFSSGVALNPVSLSAVNLEYFYGIPTPSAPARTPYATSNTSNCSSGHQHCSSPKHHGSASSNHTNCSAAQPASDIFSVTTPQYYNSTNNNNKNNGGGGDGSACGGIGNNGNNNNNSGTVQKDVLAFMAAEQQQQKFVLQQRNVYMSGLPVDFRPSAFRAMCEVFGRIESSKLCMEPDDANRCRGFGFVLFYDVDSANSCITSLNGKVMQGKTLQVRRADLSAAPQPLNPVTQRNRTGSGLVTPPTLPSIGSGAQSHLGSGTPGPATAYPMFSPHPPMQNPNNGSGSNHHNNVGNTAGNNTNGAIASSVVMSAVPFTFATPTTMGSPAHPGSNNNANLNALLPQKGSANGSSFLYGGPSASSSLGTSSTPTMVYPQNATMVPALHNGVPIMQVFATCPPSGAATNNNIMGGQPQQLVSQPSLSRSDLTSHTATPSSAGSSNVNSTFVAASQQQQQQVPQSQSQPQPQPPMHPPMQQQRRPLASGGNVAFYGAVDGQRAAMMSGAPAGNNGAVGNNVGGMMPPTGVPNVFAQNLLLQEYMTAAGMDPNASNPNIYYLFPQ